MTYDPFFKFIFNPSIHPERLSELLSLIFGEEVEIVDVIPNESDRVTEEGSLLITDILVRLRDGSYANVEIQKIGYAFPGQRCACRYDMKGLTSMFDYYRQLLREADQGTVQYMIEEQKKELDELQQVYAKQKQELADREQKIKELQAEIERLKQ